MVMAMDDKTYMALALEEAAKGRGTVSPNPMVGAIVVADGRIIGRGHHRRAGEPHAEVFALAEAGERASGADVYVTLEPCSYHGRTPACTDALIEAKVRRVVCAMRDPNPRVSGAGIQALREAGIEVSEGIRREEAERLNEVYTCYITTGLPFVTIKVAMSLDGKIATSSGDSMWVSSEESRERVHALRAESDAIMVGIGTALRDDPRLTVRLANGRRSGRPVRVVVDTLARLHPECKLLQGGGPPVIVATGPDAPSGRLAALRKAGAEMLTLPAGPGGVDLYALLRALGGREMTSVLCEGGGRIVSSLLARRLAGKIIFYYAPKIIGGQSAPTAVAGPGIQEMKDALRVTDTQIERSGPDFAVTGYLQYERD